MTISKGNKIGTLAPLLLGAGASLRLTRFLTTDTLGEWLVGGPVEMWAGGHDDEAWESLIAFHDERCPAKDHADCFGGQEYEQSLSWQGKLASGLNCPFCVGFWLTLVSIPVAAWAMAKPTAPRRATKAVMAALAVNYVTGHISSRIDG